MNEVRPGPGESILPEQVFILADASGTMYDNDKFGDEYNLVNALVQGMPSGSYDAGLSSFGSHNRSDWETHSMAPFRRGTMAGTAQDIEYLGGLTPLGSAVYSTEAEYDLMGDRAALIVFSDGISRERSPLAACQSLLDSYEGDLCIFTVLMGNDGGGAALLKDMAQLSGCGESFRASDLSSPGGMEKFIRRVFFASDPDTDGDGVPDSRDQCPGTPKGVKVDSKGCPLDTDGDGVYDYEDQCAGTPKGAKVDERGCWVLKNLNFATDKYDILPEFNKLLDEVATVLKNNPGVRIQVDGHTDSRGSDGYNKTLSANRAMAVQADLVKRGINANRLEAKGFGEAKPIKPNDTDKNMYLNRRVELTVIP
jgi:OOP family OmpA-OmpF porin